MVRGKRDAPLPLCKNLVNLWSNRQYVTIEIGIDGTWIERSMQAGLEKDAGLLVIERWRCLHIDDPVVLNFCLVAGLIGNHEDVLLSKLPDIPKGKVEGVDMFGGPANREYKKVLIHGV